jgi:UDP-glucose 4-epimerase
MRVFITGGAGFIGSHLAERCLARGDEVSILDDLSTGSIENITGFRDHPRFSHHVDSVANRSLTAELVDQADVVFHLAAAVGVQLIVDSPVRTIETNVRLTEIVLGLAAKKRKRVVLTSTSEVYGKRTRVPFSENDDLVMGPSHKGRWSYACSKALDEFLALAYWKERRVPTVVARLFNTIGPRQTGRYGMVVPNLVRQALQGRPLTVFGDGSQSRCFGDVRDVVDALIGLARHPRAIGNVYNVGNDEEVTILELARRIIQLTSSSSRITFVPYEEAYEDGFEDMTRRVPDLAKIRTQLGYTPRYDLETTLRAVIDHERTTERPSMPAVVFEAHP